MKRKPKFRNSTGASADVLYGMHMVPGVAEYKELDIRVFVNEDTIRAMGPSFAGKPVYVRHVDDVPDDLDEMRQEADGYVVESFYNEADGKHWVKFIVCSKKGKRAIDAGYRLSNCYSPNAFDKGGEWNGVSYQKEVKGGAYEHLALVPDPRYDESVVMTADEFKTYCDEKRQDLDKLKNDKGDETMALTLFKRTKLDNSKDLENTLVLLPKSNREVTITQLVNEADKAAMDAKKPKMANGEDKVKVGDKEMTVNELCNAYLEKDDDSEHEAVDEDQHDLHNDDDDDDSDDDDDMENEDEENDSEMENEDDIGEELDRKKAKDKGKEPPVKNAKVKAKKPPVKNSRPERRADTRSDEQRKSGKEKADRLANAHQRGNAEDEMSEATYDPFAGVERGKARYGS